MERQQADGYSDEPAPTRRFVPETSTWRERRAFYVTKEHARKLMESELHANVALVTADHGAEMGHRVYRLGQRLIESLLGPDDKLNLITEVLTVYHDEAMKGGAA